MTYILILFIVFLILIPIITYSFVFRWVYVYYFKNTPMTLKEAKPLPDSMWLVVADCRYEVIHVAVDGSGLYIPGQEPCWALDSVNEWIYEIKPPTK